MNRPPLEKLFFSKTRDFLDLYLSTQCSKSKHTIKAYRDALTVFRKYVVEVRKNSIRTFTFDDCTRDLILDFLEHLQGLGLSPNTCNHRLATLKAYMWYVSDGDISLQQTAIMFSRIPFLKVPEKNKELLSEECLAAILAAPKATKFGIRDTTIMVLLYDTAIRLSELIELNISSVVFDAPIPYLRIHGKGDKERIVSFTSNTALHLKNYINVYHKNNNTMDKSLFYTTIHGVDNRMSPGNIERIINKYADEIRPNYPELPLKVYPHMFRRTRATNLYQNDVSLELVSRMLGHASTQTTRIYARPSVAMLKEAIEKSPYISPNEHALWTDDEDELARLCGLR